MASSISDAPARPRDICEGSRPIRLSRLVGVSDGSGGLAQLIRTERTNELADRSFASGKRGPEVVETFVVHALNQLRLLNVFNALIDESLPHLPRRRRGRGRGAGARGGASRGE